MKAYVFTTQFTGNGEEIVFHETEADNVHCVDAPNGAVIYMDGHWYSREQFGNSRKLMVLNQVLQDYEVPKACKAWMLIMS